ncbi:MAG: dephospho-CoA kinase [Flavobacteriaceae bacterium]
MMSTKIIGLTGGIGSGKTTVASMFAALGVPIFISDEVGKSLMNKDAQLIGDIKVLFGEEAYAEGQLNRSLIADQVFSNKTLLDQLNQLVHKAVANSFRDWILEQDVAYVIKESAILFEHGINQQCHKIILVTAPLDVRLRRCLTRENMTEERFYAVVKNQWDESKTLRLADFVVNNLNLEDTKDQVLFLHQIFSDISSGD